MKLVRQVGWGRALLVLFLIWLLVLVLFAASPVFRVPSSPEADSHMTQRLARAFHDLEVLKRQNAELRSLFKDISVGDPSMKQEQRDALLQDLQMKLQRADKLLEQSHDAERFGGIEPQDEPNAQYEQMRRKIVNGVQEMWYFVSGELKKIQKQALALSPQLATRITRVLEDGVVHKRSLIADLDTLSEVDGYAAWREKEATDLSDLVQRRVDYLQNPEDCSTARKLVCNLNKGCGYGCQLHHLVYCFTVAYGTERTLILKSRGWRYRKAGWEEVFLPVSRTCTDPSGETHSHWPGKKDTQVVELPIVDSLSPRPPYLPLAVPKDLASRLAHLHGDPIVWWIGQFLKFVLRPQEATSNMIQEASIKRGFKRPIVGVHIRRTDKVGTEAAFHPLEEYMAVVDEYYNLLEMKQKLDRRRVYLASDDPKVIAEAQRKYPEYDILADPDVAKTAAVSTRYSDSSLNGIILDIHFLSLCDYLVCTFSSQVCRVAYEIMQTLYPDAAGRFRSLDDVYYYGGQSSHIQIAVLPHHARDVNEMNLEEGDLIGIAGNHWDGYSKGKNLRTNQIGLYPSFKAQDRIETADFPTYPQVPLHKPSNQES